MGCVDLHLVGILARMGEKATDLRDLAVVSDGIFGGRRIHGGV